MEWIWALGAILGAFILATIVSKIVKQAVERKGARAAEFASAAASMIFSVLIVVGLLVALGIVRPESLDQLREDTISYLPRALSALIVVILGGVLGTIVSTAARESIGRSMGRAGRQIPTVIKGVVTAFSMILAASQLGIDTTVINIVVAAGVFGIALAFALIVGAGGREVASEIAAGRALRRLINEGDQIAFNSSALELSSTEAEHCAQKETVRGKVVELHPTSVGLKIDSNTVLIPNTQLLSSSIAFIKPEASAAVKAES